MKNKRLNDDDGDDDDKGNKVIIKIKSQKIEFKPCLQQNPQINRKLTKFKPHFESEVSTKKVQIRVI